MFPVELCTVVILILSYKHFIACFSTNERSYARYHSLPGDNQPFFCFQPFALVQQERNAVVRSHGYEAKVEPHRTGSAGTAAVRSIPDGIHEYIDKFQL